MPDLTSKKCVPCEGGVPPMTQQQAEDYFRQLSEEWIIDKGWLVRNYEFKEFPEAIGYMNRVADLAEAEGHHPNFYLHGWNKLRIELYTHAIDGLSENDFIMAAKIDKI